MSSPQVSASKDIFTLNTRSLGSKTYVPALGHPKTVAYLQLTLTGADSNDILHRFMTNGTYSKETVHDLAAQGGLPSDGVKAHSSGVMETLTPAMDIIYSSNFERLLACLAFNFYSGSSNPSTQQKLEVGSTYVRRWLDDLKSVGGFTVNPAILKAAQEDFTSARIDDEKTVATIRSAYSNFFPHVEGSEGTTGKTGGYILDPHSAIGIAASLAPSSESTGYTISLATAHPAKFANAVDLALKGQEGYNFDDVLPEQFKDLDHLPKRVEAVGKDDRLEKVKSLIMDRVPASRD